MPYIWDIHSMLHLSIYKKHMIVLAAPPNPENDNVQTGPTVRQTDRKHAHKSNLPYQTRSTFCYIWYMAKLRQGDPLSPLLFNLFIADIILAFKSNCDPPILHGLPVPSIQFANYICNFSTSMQGIHNSVNTTLNYCKANKLSVNISKSCFTIYNKTDPPPPPKPS